jgi:prepilin peptidase CpaA
MLPATIALSQNQTERVSTFGEGIFLTAAGSLVSLLEETEFSKRTELERGPMRARTLLVVIVGLAAVIQDLGWRRISNWTSAGAVIAGLTVHLTQKGWSGALHSLFDAVIGFSIFLIFYLLGGMGGGDLKLMAGFGALLGDGHILRAALFAAMSGGVMAVIYLAVRAAVRRWKTVPPADLSGGKTRESILYAPAITVGALLALVSDM